MMALRIRSKTIFSNPALPCMVLLMLDCASLLLGQGTSSSFKSKSLENPVSFTPEAQGRRQLSVRTLQEEYQWRLRIPERVFCDEAVLVGHDIHRVHTPVRWAKGDDGSWHYDRANIADTSRKSLPFKIEYALRIEPRSFGADLVVSVKNTGDVALHNVIGHVCLGHISDPFRDPSYQRTFIRHHKQYLNLTKTQRGSDPVRAHYRIRNQAPIKLFDNPANRFWGPLSPEIADNGLILTQSREKTHIVALWFDPAAELFQNSDEPNMCIHSDPAFGDLEPGASAEVKGCLIFFLGTLNEFEESYLDQDR